MGSLLCCCRCRSRDPTPDDLRAAHANAIVQDHAIADRLHADHPRRQSPGEVSNSIFSNVQGQDDRACGGLFYKQFVPNLDAQVLRLTPWQRRMIKTLYVPYVEHIDNVAMSSRRMFNRMRRAIIGGGVAVAAVSMVQKVTYIQEDPQLVFIFFWTLIGFAVVNMMLAAFMTDLKMLERAMLYYRASTLLKVRGQNFLARVQDYTDYDSCGTAFRHFMRDFFLQQLQVMDAEIRLIAANPDQSAQEALPRDGTMQGWPSQSDPVIIPVQSHGSSVRAAAPAPAMADVVNRAMHAARAKRPQATAPTAPAAPAVPPPVNADMVAVDIHDYAGGGDGDGDGGGGVDGIEMVAQAAQTKEMHSVTSKVTTTTEWDAPSPEPTAKPTAEPAAEPTAKPTATEPTAVKPTTMT